MHQSKKFELGVYTFGNTPRLADGGYASTAQAIRNALEAVQLAEDVGLDFFGFGEHHTNSMPLSSPTSVINAAAALTKTIKLGATVSVLSTDDPIRVFQQLATADAVAPGRIELVAGRGSSAITFSLFDYQEQDYDMLFSSKLSLLLELNRSACISWSGPHRQRSLAGAKIYPRPENPLRLWLGSGGSPASVMRAAELGLPLFLGILGGSPTQWARYGQIYRDAWARAGNVSGSPEIAVATHGFIGEHDSDARQLYLEHELRMFRTGLAEIGLPDSPPPDRIKESGLDGMVFAGGPENVAGRIIGLQRLLGHSRQILQMDVGGLSHSAFMKSIELLGTRVLPVIRRAV